MTEVQPMKMAAAEALYTTEGHAPFSLFTIGTLDGCRRSSPSRCPSCSPSSPPALQRHVHGIDDLKAQYAQK